MFTFLTRAAAGLVGEKFAGLLVYGTALLILAAAVWWLRHDAYRDGERAADARWVAAGEKLEDQAADSASRANAASAARVERHNEQLLEEKEKLDEAAATGASPLDVLFGA